MRITIHGFSQSVACTMQDEVQDGDRTKKIRIDATDLLILRWFTDFYPNMKKRIIDGKEYGWITRKKLNEDLPILGITEKAAASRLKKLVHFGLLEYRIVKDGGTYAYYTHGNAYERLITSDCQATDLGRSNALGLGGQAAYPKGGQTPYKDSGLDNTSIKDNGKRFAPPTRDDVLEYAREKGYSDITPNEADRFIAYYESNGWMVGRNKMKSWRASVTNWHLRNNIVSKPQRKEPEYTPPDGYLERLLEFERNNFGGAS